MTRYAAAAEIHAAAFAGAERPWSADEIQTLAERPGGLFIDTPDGFALGQLIGDEAELLTIVVTPSRQNKGQGAVLLAAFEAAVIARGARRIFLDVAENNIPARKLYAAAEYSETGRRSGYYRLPDGDRVDAILMAKSTESPVEI